VRKDDKARQASPGYEERSAPRGLARIIHEALEAAVLQRDRRAVFRGVGDAVVGV